MVKIKIYSPPAAMIDWAAFGDCIISTRWRQPIEMQEELSLSHGTAHRAWHGKPIGLMPFLRICRAMHIAADKFLVER